MLQTISPPPVFGFYISFDFAVCMLVSHKIVFPIIYKQTIPSAQSTLPLEEVVVVSGCEAGLSLTDLTADFGVASSRVIATTEGFL